MPATTSAARRNPIWIFGAATGGRPIRFHALNCSGKTSLNGFARAKSSAVHSGFSSKSAGGLVLLVMFLYLSRIGFSERNGPENVAAHGENQHVQAPVYGAAGAVSGFVVVV